MIDYQNLKNSYIASIQMGMILNAKYEEVKQGNDLLHRFCENCINNSNYCDYEKNNMKRDLELVKQALSEEIEIRFHNG